MPLPWRKLTKIEKHQRDNEQSLDEVFVISRIIKAEASGGGKMRDPGNDNLVPRVFSLAWGRILREMY